MGSLAAVVVASGASFMGVSLYLSVNPSAKSRSNLDGGIECLMIEAAQALNLQKIGCDGFA
jgi:hypothetical protein